MSVVDWVCKTISLESASERLSAITISRQQALPSKLDACANVTTCCYMAGIYSVTSRENDLYAYLTHDFQRHFPLNSCLRERKLFSLYMFHRIIFILLIVSSPSRNFYRCTGCFESNINIACRNTQNAARK